MFYHISGEYVYAEDTFAVIDCGGVGYRLTVSRTTAEALGYPAEGKRAKLYTYLAVREDGVELFGFYSEEELHAFRLLTSVSGVGPKAAMAILSILPPDKLALAVSTEDVRAISRANGVGAKTAARVVLELRDKFSPITVKSTAKGAPLSMPAASAPQGKMGEAMEALTVLGYGRAEVTDALHRMDTASMTVEEMITAALKFFAK